MDKESNVIDPTTIHSIKLVTGELIVCSVEVFDDDHIVFLYPMEMSVNSRGVLQIVKWIPVSSEILYTLPIRSILIDPEPVDDMRILNFYYEGVDKAVWRFDAEIPTANTAEEIDMELEAMEEMFFRSLQDRDRGSNTIIQIH